MDDNNKVHFSHNDARAVVIIGSGAGGGTLANELAQKGIDVIVLEAGKMHTQGDFTTDEWGSFSMLSWLDKRTTSGTWRVATDFPNLPAWICKTVGGTTTHWAGASLRIKPHEFKAKTNYGTIKDANLLDWPVTGEEMAPWYDRAEKKMGVTRTNGLPGLPGNNNFKVMYNGATKVGYKECNTGHMATNSIARDDRAHCFQRGFCFQGCRTGAKWSTLYTEIPRAQATGHMELRTQAQVVKIETDAKGKASAVVYYDAAGKLQRQKARIVAVAGNAIETPRLLLNSHSSRFPDGLANSSGQVGRNYMRHTTGSVYAVFNDKVDMYKGTTMAGIIEDEARFDTSRGFAGGYHMETVSLGLSFYAAFLDPGAWGSDFTQAMDAYPYTAGMWIVGEDMPRETNRITLNTDVKDQYGLPVPNVHFDDHPNDEAMREHGFKQGSAVYQAAGAKTVYKVPPYPSTHNLGTARMSAKAQDGVCNRFGQTHDVPNLFISDGSQFTTGAAENPTLTIVTLAIRQADYIAGQMNRRTI
ncbi:GMC family oxidoreductase [Paraburkholderia hospita]|uniref:GMC family oxidoreductase n=1 Tax=Paraburkholderia hospita TaxID=169430 RepID=A0AAN1JBJ0_9BURK|nr:GMC family oxidoreductase [Paraburkholderia hospita]AUT70650.1 GMC family oxidoreductase [Paraburkholderia hospita]EIM93023.1 glucose-methanol-choline oxidoreductase [Paraburkholderia hospita]OUL82593.1 2-keto-gluconate dehydrogenase [Paraburkholderia hospita]OUL88800.1 2-keto-gluconate dehydrogenase [Paraburkholderia hospita]SEI26338.1 Choline dehydrogenase [Paraburkholderia hospita]